MRKIIVPGPKQSSGLQTKWLDIEDVAAVEVTSEEADFPIEAVLETKEGPGWRAEEPGEQLIRIILKQPRPIRRLRLEFREAELTRTQEFALRWSRAGGPPQEIVRQQWNFSPEGSTSEIEDYQVNLDDVAILELLLKPDISASNARASLKSWRIG